MIHTEEVSFVSEDGFNVTNITYQVRSIVTTSGIQDGSVLVFYRHTTGAVMVGEHEAGIIVDLEDALEALVPVGGEYTHHRRKIDANGAAHVRTALLSVSLIFPLRHGELLLGTYQEILVVEMDPDGKTRRVVVQVEGA